MNRVRLSSLSLLAGAVLLATLQLPGQSSSPKTGSLLAFITDVAGHAAVGAPIQIRAVGFHKTPIRRTTSNGGELSVSDLPAGAYYVEVGRENQIAARRRVVIEPDHRAILTISLPAMLATARFGSTERNSEDEEFRWVLRTAAAVRPVLRVLDDDDSDAPVMSRSMRGAVTLSAGSNAATQSSGDLNTAFQIEKPLWNDSLIAVSGNVAGNSNELGGSSSVVASFVPRNLGSVDHPSFSVGVRELQTPFITRLPALRLMSFNYADALELTDRLHLQYGALFNSIGWSAGLHSIAPFALAEYRIGPNSRLEYRFATAAPPVHFGGEAAEFSEPIPRVSITNFKPELERARHNELTYSDNLTPVDLVQVSVFADEFTNTYVTGAMATDAELNSGNILPDAFSNIFGTNAGRYSGHGLRIVYHRQLGDIFSASADYAQGPVLLARADRLTAPGQFGGVFAPETGRAWTVKLVAQAPGTHTGVICSYRRLPHSAVTGVDPYDDSLAQSDAFLNVAVRQPLPNLPFGIAHMEGLAEFHNLLAQGYVPLLTPDGRTVYLVESPRSFRGGLRFNF